MTLRLVKTGPVPAAGECTQNDQNHDHDRFRALRQRAIKMLSRREYSRHELRNRLGARQPKADDDQLPPTQTEIDAVLTELVHHDLQSDERFAQSLVRRRGAREGKARIAHMLRTHEIEDAISTELLAGLAASEFDRAWQVWERRFAELAQSPKEKARQARFLSSRGFSSDVISRILRGFTSERTD